MAARLGILGGTFDPIHSGHLASAEEVAARYDLERVLLVLSARPPLKGPAEASVEDRLAMLRIAVAGRPRLEASDVEARRPGASFTVDTLADVAQSRPGVELFLIVGIDAWREVDAWHRPGDLLALANVVVTTRPGADFPRTGPEPPVAARDACCYDSSIGSFVHSSGHRLVAHRLRGIEVSSSDIRRRLREGLPIDGLVPAGVADYIRKHRLYA